MKNSKKLLLACLALGVLAGCSWKKGNRHQGLVQKPMPSPEVGIAEKNTTWKDGPISSHPYSNLTRITFSESGRDFDPNISNDGDYLYFASTMHSHKPDIYRKKIFSKVVERITFDEGVDINPAISPDGKYLAFASNRNGIYQVWVKNVENGSRTPQQLSRGNQEDRNPSWSPDGTKIVFNRRTENSVDWEIWEYDLKTKQETALRIDGLYPKYSPDGSKIICQRHRNRDMPWYSIWSYTFEGEKIEEVLENARWGAVTPSYSKTGEHVVFGAINKSYGSQMEQRYMQGDDIWVIGSDGNNLIRLTNHEAPDWHPVWGKDNSVFFISWRNGHQNIWMIKPKLPDMDLAKIMVSDPKQPMQ